MHITVQCPGCLAKYQLNAELRGQKMRCPNAVCREVFEVKENGQESPPPPKEPDVILSKELPSRRMEVRVEQKTTSGNVGDLVPLVSSEAVEDNSDRRDEPGGSPVSTSGTVGDMVPVLSAEAVEEPPPEPPKKTVVGGGPEAKLIDVTPWQTAPPPVRTKVDLPAKPATPSWQAAPPPVRKKPEAPGEPPVASPVDTPSWQSAPPPVRKKAEPPAAEVKKAEPAEPVKPAEAELFKLAPEEPKPAERKPAAESKKPAKSAAPPSWQAAAPPVRRREAEAKAPTAPPEPDRRDEPGGSPEVSEAPPAWQTAPPPVRHKEEPAARKPAETATMPAPSFDWAAAGLSTAAPEPTPSEPSAPPAGRGTWWIIGLLLLVVAGGVGVLLIGGPPAGSAEDQLWKQAQAAMEERRWREAGRDFQKIIDNFPDSPRAAEARSLEAYMRVKEQVHLLGIPPETGLKALRAFLDEQRANPILETYQKSDIRDDFLALARKFLQRAKQKIPVKQYLKEIKPDLAQAGEMIREAKDRLPGEDVPKDIANDFDQLEKAVLRAELIYIIATRLESTEPTPANIIKAKEVIRSKDPELLKEPEIDAAIQKLEAEAVKHVRYVYLNRKPKPGGPAEEPAPALVIAPRLDREEAKAPFSGRVVFALARGVLYALDELDGRVVWATRVGIDTTQLPVRLRPTETDKDEIVLVLSSDTNTLCARNVRDGQPRWHIELGQPCLARPLIVQDAEKRIQRAYLPLFDGRILEIELATGLLLGEFQLGLPLTVGGAHQPGTNLLYFPGDRSYVYVLDIDDKKKQCVAILQSGHPSGSLRSEPIVVADPERSELPRYLILSQSDGLGAMKLRAFSLPITANAAVLKEEAIVGWSWFPPWCNGEKVVLATDAGVLGLVGINQYRNQDPPLFPLLPQPPGNEKAIGFPRLQGETKEPGRAVIVHAADHDLWALGNGLLQHWRIGIAPNGLVAGPVWRDALKVGTPLHAGQVSGNKLVVVTRSPAGTACLATAVDAVSGDILWQRQLGLIVQGVPAALGGRVLLEDQAGGLFLFDAERKPPWQRLAGPPAGSAVGPSMTLSDAGSVLLLRPFGEKVLLRRITAGKDLKELAMQETTFNGTLAGTPGLGSDYLVVPLADGMLLRQPIQGGAGDYGPTWRVANADPGSQGHVVRVSGHDFIVTNGSRGLRKLSWPDAKGLALGKSHDLPDRIVAAPLVLPRDEAEPQPRIVVADSSGTLRLLRVQADRMEEQHFWSLGGPVTAGPFLLAGRVAAIIEGRRLVLLEPGRAEPVWTYIPEGDSSIVGVPRLMGDVLVVADASGRIVALDPATGLPKGKGYQIRTSGSPAAAPVGYGKDQAFVPLTDGTILLVPLAELGK